MTTLKMSICSGLRNDCIDHQSFIAEHHLIRITELIITFIMAAEIWLSCLREESMGDEHLQQ